jgi:flagellin
MANVDVTRIAGNIGALNSLYALQNVNNELATHQARLATGKRLMSAADDPAGMSIATSFDIRRTAMKTTLSAIGDAKNLLSNTETGLTKIKDLLIKMENKALESKGDVIGTAERNAIYGQLKAFRDEINDIVKQTQWNGKNLISAQGGTAGSTAGLNFLTDPDAQQAGVSLFSFTGGQYICVAQGFYSDSTASTAFSGTDMGLNDAALSVSTTTAGSVAARNIDTALNAVKEGISQVGAFVARLTSKEETLSVQHANTEAAYNRIMNANMAEEQVEASKLTILQQTSTAMLAQANTAPQFLLQLFR